MEAVIALDARPGFSQPTMERHALHVWTFDVYIQTILFRQLQRTVTLRDIQRTTWTDLPLRDLQIWFLQERQWHVLHRM